MKSKKVMCSGAKRSRNRSSLLVASKPILFIRIFMSILLLGTIVSLSGCGGKENADSPDGLNEADRTEMTEEEMESGHASFQMEENLVVDADVTESARYKDGAASYYLKIFYETDEDGEAAFKKNPTVFGKSFTEWGEMINRLVPGKFKGKGFVLDGSDAEQKYIGDNGVAYSFSVSWAGLQKGLDEKTAFNSPGIWLETSQDTQLASHIMRYIEDYEDSELSFMQDKEQQADKIKNFLENVSGRKIHDRYDTIPVSKENVAALKEQHEWMVEDEPEEEMAEFWFYYDINGLPFKNLYLNYTLRSDETADELCCWGSVGKTNLTGISEHGQQVLLNKDGLVNMECSNMRDIGDIYKESTPVITPNEVLKQVKAHYEKELLTGKCVVTDIELVYTGYFSDGSEGEIQPIIAPFWNVTVYEDGNECGRVVFTYDAYTGTCIQEAVNES